MEYQFQSGKLFDDFGVSSRKKKKKSIYFKMFIADIFGVTCEEIDAIVTISNRKTRKRKSKTSYKSIQQETFNV